MTGFDLFDTCVVVFPTGADTGCVSGREVCDSSPLSPCFSTLGHLQLFSGSDFVKCQLCRNVLLLLCILHLQQKEKG